MATLINYTCESFSKLTPGNIDLVGVLTCKCYVSSESVIIIIIIVIVIASIRVSVPLVSKIEAQSHETPEEAEVQRLVYATRKEKDDGLKEELEEVKAMLPGKTQRAVDLTCEKGASNWLTVIPLKDMDFDFNKREFRDAVRLPNDWPIPDNPSVCVCGSMFTVDHAMICQRGGLVIQRHNEIRDLQAELLDTVCYDVQVEPALQPITGEELARGTNQAPDARLDVHCRGFWERQRAAFFDIRVCHPNADSYRDLSPKQIYRIHENEKKRKHNSRVTEIEQGTFTPLVFILQRREGWLTNARDTTQD